jgi:lysozyme
MREYLEYPADLAVDFVKRWEGFRACAYRCPAGVMTIGYGHTGDVKAGDVVTYHEADELLLKDLQSTAERLAPHIKVPVTKEQFIALTSLAFNLGVQGVVRKCPRLMRALNEGEYEAAANEFLDVTNGGLPGLVKRRAAERALFLGESPAGAR